MVYTCVDHGPRSRAFSQKAAEVAILLVCLTLIGLGYVLGLAKCVLTPVTSLEVLGLTVDSKLKSFKIPPEILKKFIALGVRPQAQENGTNKNFATFLREVHLFCSRSLAAKLFINNIVAPALRSSMFLVP